RVQGDDCGQRGNHLGSRPPSFHLSWAFSSRGGAARECRRTRPSCYFLPAFLLRLAFSAAPGLKRAFFDAAILISLPVAGLRPFPAARSRTEKVPNPTRRTSSPFFNVFSMPSSTASSAAAAATLVNSASAAIWSTSSSLFIVVSPLEPGPFFRRRLIARHGW